MGVQISKRRIQKLGGSSLIVTLPKPWIRKYNLSPGDEVLVVDEGSHLRILPSKGGREFLLKRLIIEKNANIVDLNMAAECAFTKGYDSVSVSVNKGNIERILEQVEEAENLDVTSEVKLQYNSVIITLVDTATSPQQILRGMRKIIIDLIESFESGDLSDEAIAEYRKLLENSVRELQRLMSRKGVTACEEAPLDPYSVGMMHVLVRMLLDSMVVLRQLEGDTRKNVAEGLLRLFISGLGGILNGSVKRTREAIEVSMDLLEKIRELRAENPELVIVESFIDNTRRVLEYIICNVIDKQERENKF